MSAGYRWKYAALIALPLLLASLSVALVIFDLLDRVSTGANAQDHESARRIVESALASSQRTLANITLDNAYWDDAARNLYGKVNDEWVSDTFGTSSEEGTNYDAVFVVDRQSPKPFAGLLHGKDFRPRLSDYLGARLAAMLAQFPDDLNRHDAIATIANIGDGLALVAVAPVTPTSDDIRIKLSAPRYLVMVRILSQDYLAKLADQYVIEGLRLDREGMSADAMPVTDFRGETVAYAQWTDRKPGDIARSAVTGKTAVALGLLAVVALGVGFHCWRLVEKLARRERQALRQALHDPLTGLPNRQGLVAEIDRLFRRGARTVAVAFIDLDGFKEVNDAYDHATGDLLIRTVARGLEILSRGSARVCRLGGDEFMAVFADGAPEMLACDFAVDLIAFLSLPFDLDGKLASVGASIGIAKSDRGEMEVSELMRRADIAMYRAKQSGKNRYCHYIDDFDADRIEDLSIARELHEILSGPGLDIAYQPIVDAADLSIVRVEALARWPASSSRRVPPDRFIAVAEKSGLIDDVGDAILGRACREIAQWPDLKLAVNISAAQLRNPDFVKRALAAIAAGGIDFDRVELEITETRLVDDTARAKAIFAQFREAGISIALDDFGTGFSSIGYLREFAFDRVKIDRSLIMNLCEGQSHHNIVDGTLRVVTALGASITAEGIETEQQMSTLRRMGCAELQGYWFARPVPLRELEAMLADQSRQIPISISA